jgi:zinc protease
MRVGSTEAITSWRGGGCAPLSWPRRLNLALTMAICMGQIVALQATEPSSARARDRWVPELRIEKYQLPNGLTVVLHEDHKSPLVAVNVIYNVGSKDDPPGLTGIAHLFEHLMFRGSEHNEGNFSWPIYDYYAKATAWTERDRTVYQTTVTRNALERVLWLEADRMGFLLPALTDDNLSKERRVVKMERRQTVDDVALGESAESLLRALYPPEHPYRHLEIGSFDGVSAARLPDISAFFEKHYAPNNAFLCIAGDFKPVLARRWIKKYFGALRPRVLAELTKPVIPASIPSCHLTLTDRVGHPRVMLVWKTVPTYHADEPALDVLASVLAGPSKSTRLFRALIDDLQVATQVNAWHPTHQLAGSFELNLVTDSIEKLDELVRLAEAEIERLKRDGPTTDELSRAKIERRTSEMTQLESVTSKASLLNRFASSSGEPLAYRSELLKVFAVTPADVVRVARKYLGTSRIRLDVLPGERASRSYEREFTPAGPAQVVHHDRTPRDDSFDRSLAPECAPTPGFVPPFTESRTLSNWLEVRIVERHELPRVILKLVVKSGEASSPPGKEGLATMTVNLLGEGTKSRSALQLEDDFYGIGATLSTDGRIESSIVTLNTITRHLEGALDLYADVILNPSFPDKELGRLKHDQLGQHEDRSQKPEKIAEDVMPRLLYEPDHPYGRAYHGTPESIRSITRKDVTAFYRRNFVPGNATLVVVGDVRPDEITAQLEARFGKWLTGPAPPPPALRAISARTAARTIYLIDKPGTLQSVVSVGRIAMGVKDPTYCTQEILRKKLVGRINSNLLYDRGCSYGFDSSLPRRNGPAPFVVTGSVHNLDTRDALLEVFKDMTDLAGPDPITQSEIDTIRDGMAPEWFDRFETIAGVADEVADLATHGLPGHYWATQLYRYAAVSETRAHLLASQYLRPGAMTVLVVGDRGWIEPLLRSLPFQKTIVQLDSQGNRLHPPSQANGRPSGGDG